MKTMISILLLGCALALADTNQLYVATITPRPRFSDIKTPFTLSNVVQAAKCGGPKTACTNITYLHNGRVFEFHTENRWQFVLTPQ